MGVIVNGVNQNITYKRCVKCISDSTCPGIKFDQFGICNFCHLHDKWTKIYPNDEKGQIAVNKIIEKIKRKKNSGSKYDCVIGVSGGRDSTYLLYLTVKKYGLNPLAVHFNDGFDNPVAGENMLKAIKKLNVDLRTITSNYSESRDLKVTFLKASTPDLNQGTDVGIAAACYGVAHEENIKTVLYGQSFRTEGIKPVSWAYMEGEYLKKVHNLFGEIKLKEPTKNRPNYHLSPYMLFYYSVLKGIKAYSPLYYEKYVRKEVDNTLAEELNWVYPGAHYYDDLYWSLITYVHREKFNIDFRLNSYSALVRDNQMTREEALERVKSKYVLEDPEVIDLCLRRLQVSKSDFEKWLSLPPKTFRDYPNGYNKMELAKPLIWLLGKTGFFPEIVYDKYFNCGY
jgi:N-acetyl sugar amidotransferase